MNTNSTSKIISTTTTSTTRRTPVIPHKAHCRAIDFGFGEGWGAAYDVLKFYSQCEEGNFCPAETIAAKLALEILERHEVGEREDFNPADCIVSKEDEENW